MQINNPTCHMAAPPGAGALCTLGAAPPYLTSGSYQREPSCRESVSLSPYLGIQPSDFQTRPSIDCTAVTQAGLSLVSVYKYPTGGNTALIPNLSMTAIRSKYGKSHMRWVIHGSP